MQDLRVGRSIRTMRVRRRWRQRDLAERAGVSISAISRLERGIIDETSLATIRKVCAPLEVDVEVQLRGRGADLDRAINERHTQLHDAVARALAPRLPPWEIGHEVSFNVYGERGVIDILLWHPTRRALLIIELKTELVDEGELLATTDKRRRLGADIVKSRGWEPLTVSTWLIVARSRTTERRIAAHRTVLRAAFPDGEHRIRAWLADPIGEVHAMTTWAAPRTDSTAPVQRVRA